MLVSTIILLFPFYLYTKGDDLPIRNRIPEKSRFLFDQGLESLRNHDSSKAIALFIELADRESGSAWSQKAAADMALLVGKNELSVSFCDRAIKLNPFLTSAWSVRGYANSELGKFSEAENDHTKALELVPGDIHQLYCRSRARREFGKKIEALDDIAEAAKKKSDYKIMYLHSILLFENLLVDEAEDKSLKLVKSYPDIAEGHLLRGLILTSMAKKKEAEAEFDIVKKIDPLKKVFIEPNRQLGQEVHKKLVILNKNKK